MNTEHKEWQDQYELYQRVKRATEYLMRKKEEREAYERKIIKWMVLLTSIYILIILSLKYIID